MHVAWSTKLLTGQVNFLKGSDGNPWVWVMGEHKDDLPYHELVSLYKELMDISVLLDFSGS